MFKLSKTMNNKRIIHENNKQIKGKIIKYYINYTLSV